MGSLVKGMIGKEDLEIQTNTNATESFNRLSSVGGVSSLSKIPDIWNGTGKIDVGKLALSGTDVDMTSSQINEACELALRERNFIINGGFDIWQRNTSFAAVVNTQFLADRWSYWTGGTSAVHTITRDTDVPTFAQSGTNFQYSMKLDCTTADGAIAAGDFCNVLHPIEGYLANILRNEVVTFSFWVKAAKIGIYCCLFANGITDRSYVAEYTVNVANTWEKKTVTFTMHSGLTGTWDFTNDVGLWVGWCIAAGTDFQTTANTWSSGNYMRTVNQVNGVDSTDNDIWFAGAQLELGPYATKFEQIGFQKEHELCERYYQKSFNYNIPVAQNSNTLIGSISYVPIIAGVVVYSVPIQFRTKMRGNPAIKTFSPKAASAKWYNNTDLGESGTANAVAFGESGGTLLNTQVGTDGTSDVIYIHYTAFAEIGASEV